MARNPRRTAWVHAALAGACFGAFVVASVVSDGVPIGAGLFIVLGTVFAAVAGNYWYQPPARPGDRDRR